jgi:hypothetical protein
MSLTGGKRKVNKSLKAWVSFVKKVQKEEKLSYKDAIHRAKVRKDKGEKWMVGGDIPSEDDELGPMPEENPQLERSMAYDGSEDEQQGGRRRRTRKHRTSRKGRTARRRRGSRRR